MISYYSFPGITVETVGFFNRIALTPTDNEVVERIFFRIEFETSITKIQILSESRVKGIREARQMIHYFLRQHTKLSLSNIGLVTNNNHTSVIHSIKTVKNDIIRDKNLRNVFLIIEEKLKKELLTN